MDNNDNNNNNNNTFLWSVQNPIHPSPKKVQSNAITICKFIDSILDIVFYPINWYYNTNYESIIGGNLYELADKGLLRYILDLNIKHPDQKIIHFKLANLKMSLITDIHLAKKILSYKMDIVKRGEVYNRLTCFFGNGAFTNQDQLLWKLHRDNFYKMVTIAKLKKYTPIFYQSLILAINNELKISNRVDLITFLSRINLISFCKTYFDIDITEDASTLITPLNRLLKYINNAMDPVFMPFGQQYNDFTQDIKIVHNYLEKLMRNTIERNTGDEDLINAFKSGEMSTQQLVEFMISIVLGGHEGTSRMLMGGICSILKNQNIINKLKCEIDVYLDKTNGKFKHSITKVSYCKYLINEAARLFPPVWICSREAREELHIDDIIIPQKTQMMFSPLLLHRDSKIWGPTCEEFIPERFENLKEYRNNIYFPFLIGPENCTGEELAKIEYILGIIALFYNYKLEIVNDTINPESAGTFRITDSYIIDIKPLH